MAKYSPAAFHGERLEVLADLGGPSLTRQEFSEECDVNALMARYDKVGVWPLPPANVDPVYMDFTQMPGSLQESLNFVMEAEASFMRLPASVRKEFDNNAVRFVEYASDGANLPKLREWGLAPHEKTPDAPMRVEVVNPAEPEKKPA